MKTRTIWYDDDRKCKPSDYQSQRYRGIRFQKSYSINFHMNIGDKVKWTSQSAGSKTRKEGEIVFVVPAGMSQKTAIVNYLELMGDSFNCPTKYNISKLGNLSGKKDHETYLVLVTSKSGRGKDIVYHPRVQHLQKISE